MPVPLYLVRYNNELVALRCFVCSQQHYVRDLDCIDWTLLRT
jgi:hypothetical protein